jgi:hypothetical protein
MVALAIVSGVYFHYRDHAFKRASAKAALATTVAWAVIVLGILGETDSMIAIALFFIFFWSFLLASFVGGPFWWHRKYEVPREPPTPASPSNGPSDA